MILIKKKIFFKAKEELPSTAGNVSAPKTKEDVASLKNELQNFPKDQRIKADSLENFKTQYISNHSIDISKLSQIQKNALDKNLQELFDAHRKVVDLRIQSKIPGSEGRYIVYKIDQMPDSGKDSSDRDIEHDLLKHAERMKLEADTLTEEADRIQAEINLKTKEGPKATTDEQRRAHLNTSYESTQKSLSKDLQESFGKKNYDSLTAGDILTMKKNGVDLSQFLLVKASGEPKEVSKASMKVGDKYIVNFGKNPSIDRWIGAGDIFPLSEISKVTINGVEGVRKSNPRPGFYRKDGKYLAIHDGDIVDIIEKKAFSNDEEKKSFGEAEISWFKNLRKKDLAEAMNTMGDVTESQNPFSLESDKALFEEMLATDYKGKIEVLDGKIKTIGGKKFKEVFNRDQKIDFSGVKLDGNTKQISQEIGEKMGVKPTLILAILEQESNFRVAATRFEPHVYPRYTSKHSPEEARMMATSYGAAQIMGFNYKTAGYSSVSEFVEAQKKGIGEQMKAFANFCMNNRPLYRAMQSTPPNFQQIAYYYNGPKYAINNYDNKIAQRFTKFERGIEAKIA